MSVVIQRESTEYLYVGVFGDEPQVNQELAFKLPDQRPADPDWEAALLVNSQHALWGDAQNATDGDYFVAVLVGSFGVDGVELAPGDYVVWLRLTDAIERPVRIVPEALEVQ